MLELVFNLLVYFAIGFLFALVAFIVVSLVILIIAEWKETLKILIVVLILVFIGWIAVLIMGGN